MTTVILSALVNGLIAGTLMAAAVWLALLLMPRSMLGASARYVAWCAVLVAVVFLPVAYLPARHAAPTAVASQADPAPVVSMPVAHALTTSVHPPVRSPRWRFPLVITVGRLPRWIPLVWALISGLMLLRLLVSCLLLARRKASAVAAPEELTRRMQGAIRSTRRVRVLCSTEVDTPVLAGLWLPAILIPTRLLSELTEAQLVQIALHEAAHLARRDDYALVAVRALQAVLPFHPAVWWAIRQIDIERELACDAAVVDTTGEAGAYAECLVRVVEICAGVRASWVGAGVGSQLSVRVNRLLDGKHEARSGGRRLSMAVAMVAALAVIAIRAPRVVALAQAPTKPVPVAASAPTPQTTPQPARSPWPVTVVVTVQDLAGQDVTGLTQSSFRIYEDGVEQQISSFSLNSTPLSVELVVDRSGSMRDKESLLDAAILQLVATADPLDEFLVVTFNDETQIAGPFGNDVSLILNQVHATPPRGGTALRDAMLAASRWTGARYQSKRMVIISDGDDNASTITAEALQGSMGEVFAITLASPDARPRRAPPWLNQVARAHGGREVVSDDLGAITDAVTNLANPTFYTLQYNSTNQALDGTFRRIKVDAVGAPPGTWLIRSRTGYYSQAH